MDILHLHRGTLPLLVSVPHDGKHVPAEIADRLTEEARGVPDTDWHVARLYDFVQEMGGSMIVPVHSRYVIDLNRGEDDVSLYPGQNTTGLVPMRRFDGGPVYREGAEPDEAEVASRIDRYWRPYHVALREELERLRTQHGRVLLWEGHSIKGELPFLFEGRLPDLNLGTANGASCSAGTQSRIESVLAAQQDHDFVANGRFKGGYITRHYGRPENGVDAVQLEISQRCYMDEASFVFDEAKAARLQPLINGLIEAALGST